MTNPLFQKDIISISEFSKDHIELILKTAFELKAHPRNDLLKDKDINIRLKEMADSSLIFIFRAWVNTKDYWIAYYDIIELIKETLDKNKIEIPYPQMDIHMKK